MTSILWAAGAFLAIALSFISFVQLIYLEALRLRARVQPPLEYFRDSLEEKIGLPTDRGAISFSMIKHCLMVLLAGVVFLIAGNDDPFGWSSFAEAAGAGLGVMMVAVYLVPQLLYRKTRGHWLGPLAKPLRLLALTVRPLTSFFDFMESLATLNEPEENGDENGASAEELDALIDAGADEGIIEEGDRKLIQSVVELSRKTVREVMTPRPNVVAISKTATFEELRTLSIEKHYSRFPVYGESIDDIIGIIHVRDLVRLDYDRRDIHTVEESCWPPLFVPETKPVDALFREMQRDNIQMAIVVDEYGETAGIATMEDVVEEVFGEIRDEHEHKADVREESDGSWLMAGHVDLDHLRDLLEFRPDEEIESTTVGGLVSEWLGHLPRVGEVVERDGVRLEVTAADERLVKQVRVAHSEPKDEGAANEEG